MPTFGQVQDEYRKHNLKMSMVKNSLKPNSVKKLGQRIQLQNESIYVNHLLSIINYDSLSI